MPWPERALGVGDVAPDIAPVGHGADRQRRADDAHALKERLDVHPDVVDAFTPKDRRV
jgi:hypothetical protein